MIKPKLFFLVPVGDIYLFAYLATESRKMFCQSMMPSAHQVNTCSGCFGVFFSPSFLGVFHTAKGLLCPPPSPPSWKGKRKGRLMEEEDSSGSCSGSSRPLDPGMAKHHGLTLTSVWLSPLSAKASKDDFQVLSALKEKRQKKIFLKRRKKKVLENNSQGLLLGRRIPCAVWIPSLVSPALAGTKTLGPGSVAETVLKAFL